MAIFLRFFPIILNFEPKNSYISTVIFDYFQFATATMAIFLQFFPIILNFEPKNSYISAVILDYFYFSTVTIVNPHSYF